jgi:hypothetical protein
MDLLHGFMIVQRVNGGVINQPQPAMSTQPAKACANG